MGSKTAETGRYTVESYFALVDQGLLEEDDRVELLDGIIVAMPFQQPPHASTVRRVYRALMRALGPDVLLSIQLPLIAGPSSAPQPDVAVLPGAENDYLRRHPSTTLLIVEVSDASLPQDRLTKSRIYAQAGMPEYWIVNLRHGVVEWHADPDVEARVYRERGTARGTARLPLRAFPDVVVRAADLLPPPEDSPVPCDV